MVNTGLPPTPSPFQWESVSVGQLIQMGWQPSQVNWHLTQPLRDPLSREPANAWWKGGAVALLDWPPLSDCVCGMLADGGYITPNRAQGREGERLWDYRFFHCMPQYILVIAFSWQSARCEHKMEDKDIFPASIPVLYYWERELLFSPSTLPEFNAE